MYVEHELYEKEVQALGDTPIWRYMGLDQLMGLLSSKRLWLSCMTTMEDQEEGLYFHPEVPEIHMIAERYRLESPMSCWSAQPNESLPMWKSYTDRSSGIVLESNVASMVKSLGTQSHDNVCLGVVQYVGRKVPLARPEGTAFTDALFRKHAAFSYEHEVRLLSRAFMDKFRNARSSEIVSSDIGSTPITRVLNSLPVGRTEGVAVDMSALIQEVRVSPFAESWFRDAVRGVMRAFGLGDKSVEHSELKSVFDKPSPCVGVPQFRLEPPYRPPLSTQT